MGWCMKLLELLQRSISNAFQPAQDYVDRPMLRWREITCFSCCGGLLAAAASTFILMVAYRESFDRVPYDTCTYDGVANGTECVDLTNYPSSVRSDLYYAMHNQYVPVSASVGKYVANAAVADSLAEMNCSLSGNVTFTYDHGNVHSNPKRAPRQCIENTTSMSQAVVLEFGSLEESSTNFVHAVQDFVAMHTSKKDDSEPCTEDDGRLSTPDYDVDFGDGGDRWVTLPGVEGVGGYSGVPNVGVSSTRAGADDPPTAFTIVKFEWALLHQAVQFTRDVDVPADVPLMTISWRVRFADLVALELQTIYDCSTGIPALLEKRVAQDCTNGRPFSVSGECGGHTVGTDQLAFQRQAANELLDEAQAALDGGIFFNPFKQCPNQILRLLDDLLIPLENRRTVDNFTRTRGSISWDVAAGLLSECPFRIRCFVPKWKSYIAWMAYAYPMLMILLGVMIFVMHNSVRLYRACCSSGVCTESDNKSSVPVVGDVIPAQSSSLQRSLHDVMARLEAQEAWRAEVERRERRVSEVGRQIALGVQSQGPESAPAQPVGYTALGLRDVQPTENVFGPSNELNLFVELSSLQDRVHALESVVANLVRALEVPTCVDKQSDDFWGEVGSNRPSGRPSASSRGSGTTAIAKTEVRTNAPMQEWAMPQWFFGKPRPANPATIGLPQQHLRVPVAAGRNDLEGHSNRDADDVGAQVTVDVQFGRPTLEM